MNSVKKIEKAINSAIDYIVANKEAYVNNPGVDFSRNRKLTMKDIITITLALGGGSLQKELYDFSTAREFAFTSSAFVQQRSKISSAAFRDVFHNFNSVCNDGKTYRGYRLIGVDGTDVNCFRNPKSDNFMFSPKYPEGYNQIHLNALYDICNKTYIDVEFQPRKKMDERKALIDMLNRNTFDGKNLIIADRGYESYNAFAHLINAQNVDFLCRVKYGGGAMREICSLPLMELDTTVSIDITTSQTNEDKKYGRHFVQTGSKKGKTNSEKTKISRWDFESPYTLTFRVVRILLDSGEYETLVTSLSEKEFSTAQIKKLYHMRWNIETSFRDLKYSIGLTHLHCKKDDFIVQEVYAALIMYNYSSRIASSAEIQKKTSCQYAYKVNFSMAVHICKKFYISIQKNFERLIYDISNYMEPVRPGRRDERNLRAKRFVGFTYRVVA